MFRMQDGTEARTVFIGSTQFAPSEILREFDSEYQKEMYAWMDNIWTPMQSDIRMVVLNYRSNTDRYTDLRDRISQGQVIPLVGSGMSVTSGLPMWSEFLLNIGTSTQCSMEDLNLLISSSRFEEAADLLYSAMNPKLLAERIIHSLRIIDPINIDGPVLLLPGLFSNIVMTTNLDNTLESLYSSCSIPFTHILNGREISSYRRLREPMRQLREPAASFLLKLHGDHNDQSERVLSSTEYDEAVCQW